MMFSVRSGWKLRSVLGYRTRAQLGLFSNQLRHYSSELVELRDYQQHVIDRCIERISANQGKEPVKLGVSLATGGGKTVIFSNLIRQLVSKKKCRATLILVHRRELVQQAAATIRKFMPNCNVYIEMGKCSVPVEAIEAKNSGNVVIASVQSLIRRLDKYGADAFDLIIVDEAHHAVADSYLRILGHFNPVVPMIGFSATFERADNKALSTAVDEIIYHRGILDMINDKWLCEGVFTQVNVNYDISNVDISKATNDFQIDKLSGAINTDEINDIIVQTYLHKKSEQEKAFRSTLLFAVDINHVNSLEKKFRETGINARSVTSLTKNHQREQLIKDFKQGKIQMLINCGIFTEGTDMPNVDCILLCRPTRSRSLLVQMIGRGLRLHHSKTHCNIIDFVGASRVGVVSIPTLVGIEHLEGTLENATIQDLLEIKSEFQFKKQEEDEKKIADEALLHEFLKSIDTFDLTLSSFDSFRSYHDYSRQKDGVSESSGPLAELNIFYNSKYPWVRFSDNAWALSLQNGHHLRIYKKNKKYSLKLYREIPSYLQDATKTRFVPRELIVDETLLKVIGKVEEVMKKLTDPNSNSTGKVNNLTKYAKWRNEPATAKQVSCIKKKLKAKANAYTLLDSDIKNYLQTLRKGQASNILFACNLAPVYPIKSLLNTLSLKSH